jgi:hypothetical protein
MQISTMVGVVQFIASLRAEKITDPTDPLTFVPLSRKLGTSSGAANRSGAPATVGDRGLGLVAGAEPFRFGFTNRRIGIRFLSKGYVPREKRFAAPFR